MASDYADRQTNPDGTFATEEDNRHEQLAADAWAARYGCEVHYLGKWAVVDRWVTKDGALACWLEVKSRTHHKGAHPDVWLNCRKWLALMLYEVAMGLPAFYLVRWADGQMAFIRVTKVDASKVLVGGTAFHVKSPNDIEPVIPIPLEDMTPLEVPSA